MAEIDYAALEGALEAWHNGAPPNDAMAALPALIAAAKERDKLLELLIDIADTYISSDSQYHARIAEIRNGLK